MLNLKTNQKQNHFRMLLCWRWVITQGNQELQSNRKQNHFRMIICWSWVLNQSERERQCLNKGTRHFRKRFIFSHQKLCLFWHGAETRVTKVRRFNLNVYIFPQKVHIFNEESLWFVTSVVTSHINIGHCHSFFTSHTNQTPKLSEIILHLHRILFIFFIFFIYIFAISFHTLHLKP